MTLREGEEFAQTVGVPSYLREEVWANRHITFIVAKKSLIYNLFFSIYGICGEGGWLITPWGVGRGLAENVRIPSYGRGGLKLL